MSTDTDPIDAEFSPDGAVTVFKAGRTGNRIAPDMRVFAFDEIPDLPLGQHEPMYVYEERVSERYEAQARLIVGAMLASLPGGTIDKVLIQLMEHRASLLRVPFVQPPKGSTESGK